MQNETDGRYLAAWKGRNTRARDAARATTGASQLTRHPSVTIQLELSAREFDLILAALRLYQYALECEPTTAERVQWITRDHDDKPVTAEEVETLAERIN